MDWDLVDFAFECALGRRVDYAEVRGHREVRDGFVLRNGEVDAYVSLVDGGFCVRVLAEGGLGFASTNRWTRDEARRVVDDACASAGSAKRRDAIVFAEEKGVEAAWRVGERLRLEDVRAETRIEALAELDRALTSQGVNVSSRSFSFETSLTEKYLRNSEGSVISSYVPRVGMYAFITVVEDGKPEQAYRQFGYTGGWEALDEWGMAEQLVHEARVLQRTIREGKAVKPGRMDLVCGPEVTGIAAHESCGHPMEADRILGREMSQAGRSFIYPGGAYWLGTRIGSPVVTVIDDPTVRNSYGYYEFDDEGVKARPRYLYKNGVIDEFLHNRETAAKLGVRSNGSSRAVSYDREAIVRMANTFVQPGDWSEDEILEGVKDGVYMRSFTEWNIDDRRFNQRYVGREAYRIEGGELACPVARPVIETTTEAFWTAVDAVSKSVEYEAATCGKGDPMQGAPVFTGGPVIRLREVHVK